MGFSVQQMCWKNQSFGQLLKTYGIQGKLSRLRRHRKQQLRNIDVVFCDVATLGPPRVKEHKSSYITENDVNVAKVALSMAPKPGESALNSVCL